MYQPESFEVNNFGIKVYKHVGFFEAHLGSRCIHTYSFFEAHLRSRCINTKSLCVGFVDKKYNPGLGVVHKISSLKESALWVVRGAGCMLAFCFVYY